MEQLDISHEIARREAEDGMRRSLEHAEADAPGWGEIAFQFARLYCQRNKGKRFVGRDVVLAAKDYGLIQPPTEKAWGSILKRAAQAGLMVRVGTTKDANRHGNPIPLWEAQ